MFVVLQTIQSCTVGDSNPFLSPPSSDPNLGTALIN
nr:MAG TPA: hypothetical protein [Bacteriophage sp.]